MKSKKKQLLLSVAMMFHGFVFIIPGSGLIFLAGLGLATFALGEDIISSNAARIRHYIR